MARPHDGRSVPPPGPHYPEYRGAESAGCSRNQALATHTNTTDAVATRGAAAQPAPSAIFFRPVPPGLSKRQRRDFHKAQLEEFKATCALRASHDRQGSQREPTARESATPAVSLPVSCSADEYREDRRTQSTPGAAAVTANARSCDPTPLDVVDFNERLNVFHRKEEFGTLYYFGGLGRGRLRVSGDTAP